MPHLLIPLHIPVLLLPLLLLLLLLVLLLQARRSKAK
jgi:hypothetical protein